MYSQNPNNGCRPLDALVDALIDAPGDETIRGELQQSLDNDRSRVSDYIGQMVVHTMITWRSRGVGRVLKRNSDLREALAGIEHFVEPACSSSMKKPSPRRPLVLAAMLAIAASLLIAARLFFLSSTPTTSPVATIIATKNVVWDQQARSLGEGLGTGPFSIAAGIIELQFHSNALLTCQGPIRMNIRSDQVVELERGNVTVKVPDSLKGFTVTTPSFDAVDLGTEFGVGRDADGNTDVLVFDGLVELRHWGPLASGQTGRRRLKESEAIRFTREKKIERIVQVQRDPEYGLWTAGAQANPPADAVITSVSDDLRLSESINFYQIVPGGLFEDVRSYVDRVHQWNGIDETGIPEFLRGADYIRTFNHDKLKSGLKVEVGLKGPCLLFVLWDARCKPLPWLTTRFTNTGRLIGMDEGPYRGEIRGSIEFWDHPQEVGPGRSIDTPYQIWVRKIEASGTVVLGPLGNSELQTKKGMFGIAAKRF